MAMEGIIPLPHKTLVEAHGKPKKHSHKTNRSFSTTTLLQERDEGEKSLQRDLAFENISNDQLQTSERLIWQIAPEVQRPQVATQNLSCAYSLPRRSSCGESELLGADAQAARISFS